MDDVTITVEIVCEDCGATLHEGDWPFCASRQNPAGHKRGSYGFQMATGMAKWHKVGKGDQK